MNIKLFIYTIAIICSMANYSYGSEHMSGGSINYNCNELKIIECPTKDNFQLSDCSLTLKKDAANVFADLTEKYLGQLIMVYVEYIPVITSRSRARIESGSMSISLDAGYALHEKLCPKVPFKAYPPYDEEELRKQFKTFRKEAY